MRKMIVFLLAGSMVFMTSCLNVIEDFYLNKDGSGKYAVMFDMSGLFENPFMKSAIKEQVKKDDAGEDAMEKDSVMYYRDMFKEDALTASERDLIKDLSMNIVMSEKKGTFYISTEIPFSSLEEYDKINAVLAKVKSDEDDGGGLGGMFEGNGPMGNKPQFKLEKRKLIRLPSAVDMMDEIDDETMGMMKMMLGEAKMKTTYHLPGKVKKTSIPNAMVDEKTVTVERVFLDILEQKTTIDGYIKYKKR